MEDLKEMTREEAEQTLEVQLGCMTVEQKIAQHHEEVVMEAKRKHIQNNTPYRAYPPKMNDTGSRSSNVERTDRRDKTLSHWSRPVGTGEHAKTDNIRTIDGDMLFVCNKCKNTVVICEASADPSRAVTFTKQLAKSIAHKTWAMRIIHAKNDSAGVHGILHLQVWTNGETLLHDVKNLPVGKWQVLVENLMIEHERNGCR